MRFETAKQTIDLISRSGINEMDITFYGGEPFLEFDLMRHIVNYASQNAKTKGIKLHFFVTTNGTLLDESRLLFCNQNDIDIYLSIDGTKKAHEIGRGRNSFKYMEKVLSLYKSHPEIPLKVQLVITPANVKYLYQSVLYLVGQDIDSINLNFDYENPWQDSDIELLHEQYHKAYEYLVQWNARGGDIDFETYQKPNSLAPFFQCAAGRNRIAVSPQGFIYGCSMLLPCSRKAAQQGTMDQFNELCMGHIDELTPDLLDNYRLRIARDDRLSDQQRRYTSAMRCIDCSYITNCHICPAFALAINKDHLQVPSWICEINKIVMTIQRYYVEEEIFSGVS
jgi:radical SAM protein with 4Fe4S-binding SPASM domain